MNTVPTGLPGRPPDGPAIPVIAALIRLEASLRAAFAIICAV
jgi:hypothetical protein